MAEQKVQVSEQEARDAAEAARESKWAGRSVMRELFLGEFNVDLVQPFPSEREWRPEFAEFMSQLEELLENEVDSVEIERTGEYPKHVLDRLRELGVFGMKIPSKYDGLGFSQEEYCEALELMGRYDANIVALVSAHQSIGVPQPVKLFGNEEQKKKYLPQCAKGAISAFALTEPQVGSDPARVATIAEKDGDEYVLNGTKLWCTNGTIAELYVVMARNPETKKISAFVVEGDREGLTVEHRCHFMGLKALANGVIGLKNVRVPKENLIGKEGSGLKIALTTLNAGRLSIPAAAVGFGKEALEYCREWANDRVQWGVPIVKHEAIGHKISQMGATLWAMESISRLCNRLADTEGYDIRLEAAAAKEWNTVQGWHMVDSAMQVRGGRGYETEWSLKARGEKPVPIERMMRDSRINTIFEGSSEVMHLFMAREAVDKHLQVAGDLVDPKKGIGAKIAALPKIALFYAWWYPTRWLGFSLWPRFGGFGSLGKHLRFVHRKSRKLARAIFHGMVWHGPKLERRQGFLFRVVDIGMELFAMAASVSRANAMVKANHPEAKSAVALADTFCAIGRQRVNALFASLFRNNDDALTSLAKQISDGRHAWMEKEGLPFPQEKSDLPSQAAKPEPAKEQEPPAAASA